MSEVFKSKAAMMRYHRATKLTHSLYGFKAILQRIPSRTCYEELILDLVSQAIVQGEMNSEYRRAVGTGKANEVRESSYENEEPWGESHSAF